MSSLNLVKIFIEIFCSLAQIIFMGFIILMIIEIDKIIRFHFNAMSYYSMQNYIILKLNNAFSYIYMSFIIPLWIIIVWNVLYQLSIMLGGKQLLSSIGHNTAYRNKIDGFSVVY